MEGRRAQRRLRSARLLPLQRRAGRRVRHADVLAGRRRASPSHAGDGIHVAAVPSFGGDCTLEGATPTPPLVIPGAREPDWGPADVPPARPVATPAPRHRTATAKPGASSSLSVKVLSATRRRGVKLAVKVPAKGKLTATAKAGTKVVGKASKSVSKAGTTTLKLKVTRKGKVDVKVTFKPTSGATSPRPHRPISLKVR